MQYEIIKKQALLNEKGQLNEAGYAKDLILTYDRQKIKANPLRIKEWDYYLIGNNKYALALTIADNSYMGLDSLSFMDFDKKWSHTKSYMAFMTKGKKNMPSTSAFGNTVSFGKNYSLSFMADKDKRVLKAEFKDFMDKIPLTAYIILDNDKKDSIVKVTPFLKDPLAFYYNQKINCLKAEGYVDFNGVRYDFKKEDSMAVLDWGRGVWTYKNTWYWGSASGYVNKEPFGFNIGYGFGDNSKASENMIFYKDKGHKIEDITFEIPMKDNKEDFLSPWNIKSSDKRLDMKFYPILNRSASDSAVIIKSQQNQVFGRFEGEAILDNNERIKFKDLVGFAEKVFNKW